MVFIFYTALIINKMNDKYNGALRRNMFFTENARKKFKHLITTVAYIISFI